MAGRSGRQLLPAPPDDDGPGQTGPFAGAPQPVPEPRFVSLNGETIFRTLYPSLASQQSCVDCHNKLQPGEQWKLGDVLGALVIDVPAGPVLAHTRLQKARLGLASFFLLCAVLLYIFHP